MNLKKFIAKSIAFSLFALCIPLFAKTGANKDNTAKVTYNLLSGGTMTNQAEGKPKVLVFFQANDAKSREVAKNVAASYSTLASSVDICFVETKRSSKAIVTKFRDTYASTSVNIAYDSTTASANSMQAYMKLLIGKAASIANPLVVFIDKNNKVQYEAHGQKFTVAQIKEFATDYVGANFSSSGATGGSSSGITATYQFHSTLTKLPAGTDGTNGTESTYYYFGDWPQTIKALNVTVDETKSITMGAHTYYVGSDGNYYAKCKENADELNTHSYSDGTNVARASANSTKYFKVEPIKWYLLPTLEGGKLLFSEKILTSNIPFYATSSSNSIVERTIDGKTIYGNNYKHSTIRAYLNGLSYVKKESPNAAQTTDNQFLNKGFLQTAFTKSAQALILAKTVDNSIFSVSAVHPTREIAEESAKNDPKFWGNTCLCEDTTDKIFLLSKRELLYHEYVNKKPVHKNMHRDATDYALANNQRKFDDTVKTYSSKCHYWLRTPRGDLHLDEMIKQIAYNNEGNGLVNLSFTGVCPAMFFPE